MRQIHLEMLKANRRYLGSVEGRGYIYMSGNEIFIFNGKGLNKYGN